MSDFFFSFYLYIYIYLKLIYLYYFCYFIIINSGITGNFTSKIFQTNDPCCCKCWRRITQRRWRNKITSFKAAFVPCEVPSPFPCSSSPFSFFVVTWDWRFTYYPYSLSSPFPQTEDWFFSKNNTWFYISLPLPLPIHGILNRYFPFYHSLPFPLLASTLSRFPSPYSCI